jgi:exodeoxyribonuclease VII small subunit
MTKAKSTPSESKTYQSMLSELDDIVRQVGQGNMDLDEIVGKIEHGYKLIATMRERLDSTKTRVEKLRVDFEKSANAKASAESSPDDDDAPF